MAIRDLYEAILGFKRGSIAAMVKAELDGGAKLSEVLDDGLIAAMDEVGRKFSEGELFVPEMLMAARTMREGLEVIKPLLSGAGTAARGTIVIGTVEGDLHDIGKNLVAMMLEGAGLRVVDLGVDVGTGKFVDAAREHRADIVCMSALLTTTMPAMEATVAAIKEAGLPVKTLVGGAPVTEAFAQKIGAGGFSEHAPGAVELVRRLLEG